MSMNDVIRQKRKELDLTQEQIAKQLGVSIPAVSKWESGAAYPDVTLIPILARILKTDVNTLLCFKQELSDLEITHVVNQMSEQGVKSGFVAAYQFAEDTIREYPTDAKLIHMIAMTLQGLMMMNDLSKDERTQYDQCILKLYEQVGASGNEKYVNLSNYMLASRAITDGDYEHAQELIDSLPEYNLLDKRMLQARLWIETDQLENAEQFFANRILTAVNELQMPLLQLIHVAALQGKEQSASRLVQCGETMAEIFGLWRYNFYAFAFEKATTQQDTKEALAILEPMLEAVLIPWDTSKCPLFAHIDKKERTAEQMNLGEKIFDSLLEDLRTNPSYAFMQQEPKFQEILDKCKTVYIKHEINDKR